MQEGISMVSFSSAISLGFQRYSEFSGRSTRAEYWWWFLFSFVAGIISQVVDGVIGTGSEIGFGVVYIVVTLALFIPGLAVCVRRLHDVGKSGWVIFINIIPIVGWVIFFVWLVTDSETDNKYGSPRSEKI